jgi:hypothetical protein
MKALEAAKAALEAPLGPLELESLFSEAIEDLLVPDPSRALEWVYAGACRALETRLANESERYTAFGTVLETLQASGMFSLITKAEQKKVLHFEFTKYKATGGWEAWLAREQARQEKQNEKAIVWPYSVEAGGTTVVLGTPRARKEER